MTGRYQTKIGRNSRRGAFINGVWHCDCEPRLPAEKFQTKNGGKNHGRWFFTCQKPQPKRCSFFLWADEAKVREESAVLNNSRTEAGESILQTPRKSVIEARPITPVSRPPREALNFTEGLGRRKRGNSDVTIDETYDLLSSGDEELAAIADNISTKQDYETPRKVARTPRLDSPGKGGYGEISPLSSSVDQLSGDVFLTPSTSTKSDGPFAFTPLSDQSRNTQQHIAPPHIAGVSLVSEALEILKPANLAKPVEEQLVELLTRHELRARGVTRGRDITRLAVHAKEKKIAELQSRITSLESERETSRVVIAHLKHDIVTSPKRPRRPPNMQLSKSEV